jgi:SAM-dependent methyltransferase
MQLQHSPQRCPVCLSQTVRSALQKDGVPILRCEDCRLRFCPSEPDRAALARLYGEAYFTGGGDGYEHYLQDEATHRRQARRYLRRIARLGIRPGRLLDVGCAAGFFLDEARCAGWQVTGVDVSPYAVRHAREVLGLDVHRGDFLAVDLPPNGFDLVTAFNVFEHLPSPRATADRLARLVRPEGFLLIETWDAESLAAGFLGARWHQYSPEYVPYYYTRRSLERLFGRAVWRTVAYGRWAKWISVERACAVLAHTLPTPRVARMIRAVGDGRLGALELPYALGDLVLLAMQRQPDRRRARPSVEGGLPAYISRERRRPGSVAAIPVVQGR